MNSPAPRTKTGRSGQKFTADQQLQIIGKIAAWESYEEVKDFVKENFRQSISATTYSYYKSNEKWQPVIRKERDKFNQAIAEIPLANKRKRVEELVDLFQTAKNTDDRKEARECLKEIRAEVGEKVPQNFFFTQFNQLTEMELEEKRIEAVNTLKTLRSKYGTKEITETTES